MKQPEEKTTNDLQRAEGQWRDEYAAQIGTAEPVRNRSGIEVKPLYTPRDWDGSHYAQELAFPGQWPNTRGIYPTMHRGRAWSQRQLIGLGTPEDYNARLKAVLAAGATFVPGRSAGAAGALPGQCAHGL